jgi:hypothetical protein
MVAVQESATSLGEPVDEFDVESVAATAAADWPSDPPLAEWFRNVNTLAEYEALTPAGAKSQHPLS